MSGSGNTSEQKRTASQAAIWTALITLYIVWGSTYLAIRYAVMTIPPFYMASLRFLIAGVILFIFRKFSGDPWPSKREWLSSGIIGLFLLVGGNGGVVWAEQRVPSSLAALLVGTVPLWMIVIDVIRHGGKWPTSKVLWGVIIGFIGITVLFWPGNSSGGTGINMVGAAVLVVGAVSWAFGSLYSRTAVLPSSPLLGTSMEMLLGGIGLFLLGTVTGEASQVNLQGISTTSLWGVAYLITFGSLVGFAAYTWALRVAPISLVSTYAYVNPLVAIILGFFIANEQLSLKTAIAAAIILGSVVLTTFPTREKTHRPAPVSVVDGDDGLN